MSQLELRLPPVVVLLLSAALVSGLARLSPTIFPYSLWLVLLAILLALGGILVALLGL